MNTKLARDQIRLASHGVLILSHAQATEFVPPDAGCVLLRIVGSTDDYRDLPASARYDEIGYFRFDDVTIDGLPHMNLSAQDQREIRLISEEDGANIAKFIDKHLHARLFVVHCAAGRSRSAAVALEFAQRAGLRAAATLIRDSGLWQPNPTVGATIRRALQSIDAAQGTGDAEE